MALHPSFPDDPHALLDPAIRWFPADEALREKRADQLMPPLVPMLRKEVKAWTVSDLGIPTPQNRTKLEALFVPETKVETEFIDGDTPQEKAEKLAGRLREAKLI